MSCPRPSTSPAPPFRAWNPAKPLAAPASTPCPTVGNPDGTVKIGSLELLQRSDVQTLFNTSDPALRTGSVGEETSAQVTVDIGDWEYDLVIMNPPFTRATNHEGAHADITNPAFAAFDATPEDQTEMGKLINEMGKKDLLPRQTPVLPPPLRR